mmetsp:Transcript_58815/g.111025  ORF Transcript_58815/g.111025 Transcript_58815/m.111025 type:complete len:353 (+) Transcript_58815:14-1072(+)
MSLDWGNHQRSMSNGGRNNRSNVMQRKPPENARYAAVKSKVESGSTTSKPVLTPNERAKRLSENFFRIGPRELFELLEEYERTDADEEVAIHSYGRPDYNPRVVVHEAEAKPIVERPYLILDVRDEVDFRVCHIAQALNFPQRLLMQDRSTTELVDFKNREGKLIVLYDDAPQQRLAGAAAQILATRGFDNIYILTGGLSGFTKNQRGEFVNGSLNSHIADENLNTSGRRGNDSGSSTSKPKFDGPDFGDDHNERRSHSGSSNSKIHSMRSQCNSVSSSSRQGGTMPREGSSFQKDAPFDSRLGGRGGIRRAIIEANEDAVSRTSNASVADSVISRAMVRKSGNGYGNGHRR